MTIPPSIANLGAPKNATPELMAELRAEKARQAALIQAREVQRLHSLADYVEQHPESVNQAKAYVDKFLGSPGHVRLHWALEKWSVILSSWSLRQIAGLLRDRGESSRALRETSPFARPASQRN